MEKHNPREQSIQAGWSHAMLHLQLSWEKAFWQAASVAPAPKHCHSSSHLNLTPFLLEMLYINMYIGMLMLKNMVQDYRIRRNFSLVFLLSPQFKKLFWNKRK